MNAQDRKTLEGIQGQMDEARATLEDLVGDLEGRVDNMGEYFQVTERLERMEAELDEAREVLDTLEELAGRVQSLVDGDF